MLTPTADNVMLEIVTRAEQFAKEHSSLLMPDNLKQDEPDRGRVLAIGPDVVDPGYAIGDLVIYKTKEVFQGFKLDGKDLVFMHHWEIIAKIIEEES